MKISPAKSWIRAICENFPPRKKPAIRYLKVYANHMKVVQVMATINLQCNSTSQIHSSVYFRLKIRSMTGRA